MRAKTYFDLNWALHHRSRYAGQVSGSPSAMTNDLSLVLLCLKSEEGVVELDLEGFDWSAWLFEGISSLCSGSTPSTKKQTFENIMEREYQQNKNLSELNYVTF